MELSAGVIAVIVLVILLGWGGFFWRIIRGRKDKTV